MTRFFHNALGIDLDDMVNHGLLRGPVLMNIVAILYVGCGLFLIGIYTTRPFDRTSNSNEKYLLNIEILMSIALQTAKWNK